MRPVLVITHLRDAHLGLVGETLAAADIPVVHRNLFSDESLPPLDEVSGLASLGGQMSVIDRARYPFLGAELDFLKGALRARLPVIGLCLGAQLLAIAAGGRVTRMEERYIGWPHLSFEAAAAEDPLFHGLDGSTNVIKWHLDAIEPPETAAVLASTPGPGCAIFRAGPSAWGSQMHLEATPEMLFDSWLVDPVEQRALAEAALDPGAFAAQSRQLLPRQMRAMAIVFERFAEMSVLLGYRRESSGGSTSS